MNLHLVRALRVVADLATLTLALWSAFLLRFEGDLPSLMFKRLVFLTPYVVGVQYLALQMASIHRVSWRFVGLREAKKILFYFGGATLLFLCIRFTSAAVVDSYGPAQYAILPTSVILINFILAGGGIVGIRLVRRSIAEGGEKHARMQLTQETRRTILLGAGQAGLLMARELDARPDLGIRAIGFVDDDPAKAGSEIHGVRVLGTTNQLAEICARYEAEQILITIASAPRSDLRKVHALAQSTGIPVKIVPGLYEIAEGRVNISRIRDVSIDDLLGRPAVELGEDLIASTIADSVVLVTGAGGSIGSELCRQILRYSPRRLLLLEQAENSLFFVHRELTAASTGVEIVPYVADITDAARVDQIFRTERPRNVFHAAAHKHVPMMERNPGEAVKNNVFGSQIVADAANIHGAERFVLISTDKAVNPTSVMGCTKRLAELYVVMLSRHSKTRFSTVRFGNVLGSAGSVVPIFKKQIEGGGPVTITDPRMTRYFMTIPEASQLVLQAAAMAEPAGGIFILDMGQPVKIIDLARDLIRLSGLEPESDIAIVTTGVRPGEKLHEELSSAQECAARTRHPKIFIGSADRVPESLRQDLEKLQGLVTSQCDGPQIIQALKSIVPEFSPYDNLSPHETT